MADVVVNSTRFPYPRSKEVFAQRSLQTSRTPSINFLLREKEQAVLRIRCDCSNKRAKRAKSGEQKFDAIFGHLSKLQMFRETVDERVELTTSGTGEEQSISSEGKVDRVFLHCSRGFGILLRSSFDRRCSSITETRRNYGIVNARRSFRVNVPRWIKITTNDRRLSVESSRLELLLRVSARLQHGVTRKEIGDHPFVASVVRVDFLERKGIINFLFLIRFDTIFITRFGTISTTFRIKTTILRRRYRDEMSRIRYSVEK